MATSIVSGTTSPKDKAIAFCCAKNYHQSLWLPETADHPKLRVTFSTTPNFDNASLPALLFMGPMFGSRYNSLEFSKTAADCGVRIICVDRPGMGGSTPVPLKIRMQVWLETVPVLLQTLGVEHVGLFTHSAGAMYTLNTLVHLRSILDPKAPYVAFLAPFVPGPDSHVKLIAFLHNLPLSMLNSWSSLNSFINTRIMPMTTWSGGIFSASASLFTSSDLPGADPPATSSAQDAAELYGVDQDTAREIEACRTKYLFAEDTTAANEEAKLCLQKTDDAEWGVAADYESCVRGIAALFNEGGGQRLRVEAYFGASDVMIGKKGQEFFEGCWRQDGVGEGVDFETKTVEGTNHDSVLFDLKKGPLRSLLDGVARRARAGG